MALDSALSGPNPIIKRDARIDSDTRDGVIAPQRAVTLVEGSTFCVSDQGGDIEPLRPDGLFVRDTRILSRWALSIDGNPIEPLTVIPAEPYDCVFVGRATPRAGNPDATLIVERHRLVGQGMREDITLRNYGKEAAGVDVSLSVDADFADLFQVKERRIRTLGAVARSAEGQSLRFQQEHGNDPRGVRVSAPGARVVDDTITVQAVVPPQGSWTTTIEVLPIVNGVEIKPYFPIGSPLEDTIPAERMRGWRAATARITVDNESLATALSWSRRDLGALRIVDEQHPDDDVVAAGAPWFMALFGRDSLLTSWMMMPFSPELALGTLRTLARLQGTKVDQLSEEQPGRILHEVRLGADPSLALGGNSVYYGSIDSTPLFVMLVGHALRWGVPKEQLESLLPAVDRALEWIKDYGDRDGDGFVEYQRSTDRGLMHQGWKDSFDAISFRDGRAAETPIAMSEVQGYVYAAYLAKATIEQAWGHDREAATWRERAAVLKKRFHEAFWMPDRGFYAIALDRDKRPVDSTSSNIGQCLWTGIVDEEVADQVVAKLVSDSLFTGFGIRTLSQFSAAYNPVSYHNGSVWPHDSVLTAAGIAAYGYRQASEKVWRGLLDTAKAFGGRLPELFCGFDRAEKRVPVPYPTSCSPQAWAAAVPFEILRISLNLNPNAVEGVFRASALPEVIQELSIDGLSFGPHKLSVRATPHNVSVTGLPPWVRFEPQTRDTPRDRKDTARGSAAEG
jgi:glycogen debranching enzyme